MRMRRKKHGAERIAACAEMLIASPEDLLGNPSAPFGNKREALPLCLEIGCGKGSFACGLTAKEPDINLIAMERVADVACLALEKARDSADTRPDNLRFIIGDARNLADYFPESSLDRIYINFCDPWTKKGYTKRRLTYRAFLEIYRRILKDGGRLIFKTDNEALFDFSVDEFRAAGLEFVFTSRDLHSSERAENNVVTEYEASFSSQGMPIYCAEVIFDKRVPAYMAELESDKKKSENIISGDIPAKSESHEEQL